MKTLAPLDSADLDLAFGGVSRGGASFADAARGSSLNLGQLASDFGVAVPKDLSSTLDAVGGLMGTYGAAEVNAWCGAQPAAQPQAESNLAVDALGCTMDVSGADAYAEPAADDSADDGACGEPPPPMECAGDEEAAAVEAADVDPCGTLPPGGSWDEAEAAPATDAIAPTESLGAAGAPGGVLVTTGAPPVASGGGWFDVDASPFAEYAQTASASPQLAAASPFADANDHRAPASALATEAFESRAAGFADYASAGGTVRDHR